MTVTGFAFAASDVDCTVQILRQGGYESNPLARPITNLPTPAYVAVSMIGEAGVDWFGLKLQESRNPWLRRFWWAPQLYMIQANVYGTIHTERGLR